VKGFEEDAGWEGYIDYIFPEDLNHKNNLEIFIEKHPFIEKNMQNLKKKL